MNKNIIKNYKISENDLIDAGMCRFGIDRFIELGLDETGYTPGQTFYCETATDLYFAEKIIRKFKISIKVTRPSGYWKEWKFDKNKKLISLNDSKGFWVNLTRDEDGKTINIEDSEESMTPKQELEVWEKLCGYDDHFKRAEEIVKSWPEWKQKAAEGLYRGKK